jgi:hypothetical protein
MKSIPAFLWFEILALVACILAIGTIRKTPLIYFLPFLTVIVVVELFGINSTGNGWLYNLLNFILIPFWIYLFTFFIKNERVKIIAWILLFLFLSGAMLNILFIQQFRMFNNYTFIAGSAIIIFLVCYYFFELLKQEDIFLLKHRMFWISAGALCYFTGTFLYFSLYSYLRRVQVEQNTEIFDLIIRNLIILLYSCITVGILLPKEKNG